MLQKNFCWIGALLTGSVAFAQAITPSSAPAAQDEPIELSPFVTTAASEKGYVATSSLAGSRVNTNLKDIAAQIDVLTPEFLSDIAATNMDEAVAFSTNNGTPGEQNVGANNGIIDTRSGGRARGFDAITNSADFYATNLPSDFYNIERVTIANGPQSILFGLGNAGGAIDISTKRALMRNRNEVGFRIDNNHSFRTTLDLNRVIVPGKLALRFAAVDNDGRSYVADAYNRQKRIFGTVTAKPFTNTTVRVSAERMGQRASLPSNYIAHDLATPWIRAGRTLFDNSTGNAAITAAAFPLLNRATNALRVVSYGEGNPSVLVWNGSALTRGPHQLAGVADTRVGSITDDSIFPTDRDVRVGGRRNRLYGSLLRGAVEQKITNDLFVEFGFNYESVSELRGGPFDQAESINILADPNRYLPGGTAAAPQRTLNPNAGRLYLETFPSGTELRNDTREFRLTTSYQFDFARHFQGVARHFGRHKLAALASWRIDQDRSQASRAMVLGNPSFATGDLLNNSRLLRVRYYLDPASGNFTARPFPGSKGDAGYFGPWTFTDTATNESFQATMFDDPAGRQSATGGSRKDIDTGMIAWQGFFFKDRLNLFAGRRVDRFRSFLVSPAALIRGDRLTPGDRQGLFLPLSQSPFDKTAAIDDRATTYSYGAVVHVLPWLSLFASKSDNTSLPPGSLDPNNRPLRGISSDGYDYGFRVSLRDDAVSMRVNFYKEHQMNLIGDAQDVKNAATVVEQRLRGIDRPAGIANVPADGFDPVTRGNVYQSVEDKIGRGVDLTLVARLTSNWDARLAIGHQDTHVYNKGVDFHQWVARRLPVWQSFGGLGWDRVAISNSDSRTVHQYYDQDIATEILRDQLRNGLPRFRQRDWRGSLFTNYRFNEGRLRSLNIGGGVRWLGAPVTTGFYQRPFPDGTTGDDVTKPIGGKSQTAVDLLAGYGGKMKVFGGRAIGWRLQLNIRNVLDDHDIEPIRSTFNGAGLEWGRVEPRQIILSSTFTF